MASIIGNLFGGAADKSADETMAFNAMTASSGAAAAYLAATLEATTPEVRRLFGEYTTQCVMANEAAMALAVKKGWVNPYDAPTKQLQTSVQQSQNVLGVQ